MNKLTGIKDLDQEILGKVDDRELLRACSVDKRMWNEVCDDNFLRRRLEKKYPGIEEYKPSWKEFFLDVTRTIAEMKEEYDFTYTGGNYKKQYNLLKKYGGVKLLEMAIVEGELSLVPFVFNRWEVFEPWMSIALRHAVEKGYLNIVKLLVEKGTEIREHYINIAIQKGYTEIAEYLRSKID